MRLNKPELFERSVALETHLNTVRAELGKDQVYFSDRLKPLDVAIPQGFEQIDMFDEDASCSSGYCWT